MEARCPSALSPLPRELRAPEVSRIHLDKSSGHLVLSVGDLDVSLIRCEARVRGGPAVSLTAAEFILLNHLLLSADRVVSHTALARLVCPRPLSPYEAAILVKHHVRALRRKLEAGPSGPRYLLSVRGKGYRLHPGGAPGSSEHVAAHLSPS
jgi:DNA-binding response OmpR family regulator